MARITLFAFALAAVLRSPAQALAPAEPAEHAMDQATPAPPLDVLVTEALAHSPALAAARAEVEARRAGAVDGAEVRQRLALGVVEATAAAAGVRAAILSGVSSFGLARVQASRCASKASQLGKLRPAIAFRFT